MNTAPELLPLPPAESPDPALAAPLSPADSAQRRRNGKIAHLPKAQRDLINHGLDEGLKYEDICRNLAEQGVILSLKNISDWFHGGYQDELKARERRAQVRQSQDRLLEIARHDDAPDLSLVGLQLAVTQLSEQLYDLAPGSHKENFQTDTDHYLRMLNTLARTSKVLLSLQQYRDQAAKSGAAELKQLDEDRDISDNECLLLVNRMDRVFRRRRPSQSSSSPERSEVPIPNRDSSLSAPVTGSAGIPAGESGSSSIPNRDPSPAASNPAPAGEDGPSDCRSRREPRPEGPVSGEAQITEAAVAPESSPPAPQPEPAPNPLPPSTNHEPQTTASPHASRITHHESERCHYCRKYLPPRLPNGQRPFTHCQLCGTALRPLELLHLYCPTCGGRMDSIFENGHRTSNECPHCFNTLPDATAPPSAT